MALLYSAKSFSLWNIRERTDDVIASSLPNLVLIPANRCDLLHNPVQPVHSQCNQCIPGKTPEVTPHYPQMLSGIQEQYIALAQLIVESWKYDLGLSGMGTWKGTHSKCSF